MNQSSPTGGTLIGNISTLELFPWTLANYFNTFSLPLLILIRYTVGKQLKLVIAFRRIAAVALLD